jgi:hypothetical protein
MVALVYRAEELNTMVDVWDREDDARRIGLMTKGATRVDLDHYAV